MTVTRYQIRARGAQEFFGSTLSFINRKKCTTELQRDQLSPRASVADGVPA